MYGTSAIKVDGRGWNVEFTLDDTVSISQVEQSLRDYLSGSYRWYDGAIITVNVGRRMLSPEDLCSLKRLLEQEFHVRIGSLQCKVETLQEALAEQTGLPISLALNGLQPGSKIGEHPQEYTKLVKGTCRSGTIIHHLGDLVVFGDVNPGSEVAVTGDILVFGALRGIAHAGVEGTNSVQAVIIAFSMQPAQLRIGPHLAMAPVEGRAAKTSLYPEIAYIKGDNIVVAPYSGWFQLEEEGSTLCLAKQS